MLASRISPVSCCMRLHSFKFSSLSCSVLQGRCLHYQTLLISNVTDKNSRFGQTYTPLQAGLRDPLPSAWCSGLNVTGALSRTRHFSTSVCHLAKELSEKGDIVYRGAISGMIRGVKIFSLSTSLIGLCLQPMLIFSREELPVGLKFAFGGIINFFVFMNPLIIHYIAKKYVTELRWNRQTGVFTAATWSFLVLRKELQFTAEDVHVPDVPGMFTFLEAKGTPLFFDPKAFEDSDAYIHLMGFDKPLDWELPKDRGSSTKSDS